MAADWSALTSYLRTQADQVTLSWAEFDAVVGGLPASALDHTAWWGGDRPQTRAWRSAGFELLDRRPGMSVSFARVGGATQGVAGPTGSSHVQRAAEPVILKLLSQRLGIRLAPRRLTSPSGAYVDVDGVSDDGSTLVECWAHQGAAKVAQKYKLVNDAAKLQWAASWLDPAPTRLILCVTDELAVKHLRGRSWQGQAISTMGVTIEVVQLPAEVITALSQAQAQQFR